MTAELFLTYVIVAVLGLLVGYSGGRGIGQEEGEREGVARAPLQLRELAYRRGICPICGSAAMDPEVTAEPGNPHAVGVDSAQV